MDWAVVVITSMGVGWGRANYTQFARGSGPFDLYRLMPSRLSLSLLNMEESHPESILITSSFNDLYTV